VANKKVSKRPDRAHSGFIDPVRPSHNSLLNISGSGGQVEANFRRKAERCGLSANFEKRWERFLELCKFQNARNRIYFSVFVSRWKMRCISSYLPDNSDSDPDDNDFDPYNPNFIDTVSLIKRARAKADSLAEYSLHLPYSRRTKTSNHLCEFPSEDEIVMNESWPFHPIAKEGIFKKEPHHRQMINNRSTKASHKIHAKNQEEHKDFSVADEGIESHPLPNQIHESSSASIVKSDRGIEADFAKGKIGNGGECELDWEESEGEGLTVKRNVLKKRCLEVNASFENNVEENEVEGIDEGEKCFLKSVSGERNTET
jgi:hypothetical protein